MPAESTKELTSALLLNAAIMPGSGHYALGLRRQGAAIMTAVVLLVIAPIARFTLGVLAAIRHAAAEAVPLRTLEALSSTWQAQRSFLLACLFGIVAIWIYAIADIALRLRRGRANTGEGHD